MVLQEKTKKTKQNKDKTKQNWGISTVIKMSRKPGNGHCYSRRGPMCQEGSDYVSTTPNKRTALNERHSTNGNQRTAINERQSTNDTPLTPCRCGRTNAAPTQWRSPAPGGLRASPRASTELCEVSREVRVARDFRLQEGGRTDERTNGGMDQRAGGWVMLTGFQGGGHCQ